MDGNITQTVEFRATNETQYDYCFWQVRSLVDGYRVLLMVAYQSPLVEDGSHSLRITVNSASFPIQLDYAQYTVPISPSPAPKQSSTSAASSSSSSSTTSSVSASATRSSASEAGSNTKALIGGAVVGSIGVLLLLLIALTVICRRRQSRRRIVQDTIKCMSLPFLHSTWCLLTSFEARPYYYSSVHSQQASLSSPASYHDSPPRSSFASLHQPLMVNSPSMTPSTSADTRGDEADDSDAYSIAGTLAPSDVGHGGNDGAPAFAPAVVSSATRPSPNLQPPSKPVTQAQQQVAEGSRASRPRASGKTPRQAGSSQAPEASSAAPSSFRPASSARPQPRVATDGGVRLTDGQPLSALPSPTPSELPPIYHKYR